MSLSDYLTIGASIMSIGFLICSFGCITGFTAKKIFNLIVYSMGNNSY